MNTIDQAALINLIDHALTFVTIVVAYFVGMYVRGVEYRLRHLRMAQYAANHNLDDLDKSSSDQRAQDTKQESP